MNTKKIAAAAACAVFACANIPLVSADEETMTMNIIIDGAKANTAENMLYRGSGMVSANNTSRLLLDYKAENPEAYEKILRYIFGEDGLCVNHLKVEMGADINSSSGTEPSVKRYEDEKADVTRGAGYQLAADALKINPDITLDMLWWSEPLWVSNAENVYAARYKWYKETLDAAYETYGLKFQYVSATQNERAADNEWIKYLSEHLKSETECPYDYSSIKIVAGEEVCSWNSADAMLADEELLNAVDVVGSHYTSWSTDNAKKLAKEYGKELWFSEASSSMVYAQGTYKYDGNGSGMNDLNGVLDIANRFITMYPGGLMTLCEYQPVVSAYYDGAQYTHKQFISATDPWSGYFFLDSGFFMKLHFSQFIKKGWAFVDDACYGDGKAGGDGHALVDATYSYMTATDIVTGDYSTVITNTTDKPIGYSITVQNLDKANSQVYVWETRGPDGGEYNENYFKQIDTLAPQSDGDKNSYSVTVKPYSIITLSTLNIGEKNYSNMTENDRTVLELPYSDDFEYSDYQNDYISSRGGAPRYTTDQGGAFEVRNIDGNNVLMQMITPDIKANEWGGTPEPVTCFGDDRWYNYSISADIQLEKSENLGSNYAGVGLRYNLGCQGASGYHFQIWESGTWKLLRNGKVLEEGSAEISADKLINVKLSAYRTSIKAYIGGEQVCDYDCTGNSIVGAGRAALYSSYNRNMFDNLVLEPTDESEIYAARYDNTDSCVEYSGSWTHETISSFKNYKRTVSTGEEGSSVTLKFSGTGFAATGITKSNAVLSVEIDGNITDGEYVVPKCGFRQSSFYKYGLENGEHTAVITVKSGTFAVDSFEVLGAAVPIAENKVEAVEETIDDSNNITEEAVSNQENVETASENSNSDEGGVPVGVFVGIGASVAAAAAVGVAVAKKKKKHE